MNRKAEKSTARTPEAAVSLQATKETATRLLATFESAERMSDEPDFYDAKTVVEEVPRLVDEVLALRSLATEAVAEVENVERGWHAFARENDPERPQRYRRGGTLTALRACLAALLPEAS